ncbi:MAG: thiolase family protein [Clostridia bacterium]|nr:MAG: thiolase family protein [Clostridia bacterium]
MNQNDIVITSACRTPFGRYGGSLKDMDYFDLGAIPMREVLRRVGLDPASGVVEEVYWGVGDTSACKDVFTPVAARQTLLKAGLPPTTPSTSLDKACVSAMSAVKLGCTGIKAGEIRVAIGGGATSFSQEPLILRRLRFDGFRLGNVVMEDPLFELGYKDFAPVAVDAGNVALKHGVTREQQDEWAVRSHQKYGEAWAAGKFQEEMIRLEIPQKKGGPKVLEIDEQYRADTTLEKLAKLPPIYGSPTCTAGNAPGLNDGAAAILIMTRGRAAELGLSPLATIVSMVSIATEPSLIAETPAYAIQKALRLADLTLDDIAIIEINEAFAAMPLVSTKLLADGDAAKLALLREKTNINGSAIAIGHANAASGARIMMNLVYELRRRGGGYAAGAICGGLGQGDACILRVD